MIKPHYYYTPTGFGDSTSNNGSGKAADNQCVVQIWKVIMDNLFTQDKSSFSELLSNIISLYIHPLSSLVIFGLILIALVSFNYSSRQRSTNIRIKYIYQQGHGI
jgi:hypothetical protein